MSEKLALVIKTKCQPGKRDEVRALWEKHLQPHSKSNTGQEMYVFCYDNQDADTLYLFEIYSSQAAFGEASQQPWFGEYMAAAGPLLAGQPEVGMATPLFAKGADV